MNVAHTAPPAAVPDLVDFAIFSFASDKRHPCHVMVSCRRITMKVTSSATITPNVLESNMKTFLAVYLGKPELMAKWNELSERDRADRENVGRHAWKAWVEQHKDRIVGHGSPLGRTKRVSLDGIADVRNDIVAYTVVLADSHEKAATMFKNHPHFTHFPGYSVEVMECLPVPTV